MVTFGIVPNIVQAQHPPGPLRTIRERATEQVQNFFANTHLVKLERIRRAEPIVPEPSDSIERVHQCPPAPCSAGQVQQFAHLVIGYGQPEDAIGSPLIEGNGQMVSLVVGSGVPVEINRHDVRPGEEALRGWELTTTSSERVGN